jgi:hypothetical protein
LLLPLCGCATIAVYEPTTSVDVALTAQQSQMHKAAEAYGEDLRSKNLAAGQTSFGTLAGLLTGKNNEDNSYWKKIGADKGQPPAVIARVRGDAAETAVGLTQLDQLAKAMMAKTQPSKTDVAEFEGALIHAGQARDSLAAAIAQVNKRSSREYEAARELEPLDTALTAARKTADELAAEKATAPSVADGPQPPPLAPPSARAG